MATQGGAKALGLPAGALAPGMRADLTMVRLDRFHLQPASPDTIVTNLVHAARGSDVDMVMVDGKIVVENGIVQTVDADAIRARAAAIGAALLEA
jgi:5-methylthioadenosine/S-adenosylhomocysteine deaminase